MKMEVISQLTFSQNITSFQRVLEMENCTYDHFPRITKQAIKNAGVLGYQCIKNQDLSIGGYWDDVKIEFLIIRVSMCKNSTDSDVICASEEDIKKFVFQKPLTWNIYYQNSAINTNIYDNPISHFIHNIYNMHNIHNYMHNHIHYLSIIITICI
jgi:hypothetical protein